MYFGGFAGRASGGRSDLRQGGVPEIVVVYNSSNSRGSFETCRKGMIWGAASSRSMLLWTRATASTFLTGLGSSICGRTMQDGVSIHRIIMHGARGMHGGDYMLIAWFELKWISYQCIETTGLCTTSWTESIDRDTTPVGFSKTNVMGMYLGHCSSMVRVE